MTSAIESQTLTFSNEYFEDQVRDRFFVPGEIKRAWAAELEVLNEVDKICRKHDIQYFADWGTLLATVRHGGFIPWDDDLDIVMKRADYNKFMSIANEELPEGFEAYNFHNHDDFWLFLGRVVGKKRICFEPEHLARFHQFPYIAGVDIFVLDYVSRDDEKEKERDDLALYIIATADGMADGKIKEESLEIALEKIASQTGAVIPRNLRGDELRRFLYGLTEELFDKFDQSQADFLTQLYPFGMKDKNFRFPKECYDYSVRLPFENTTMPVPIRYIEMLRRRYGDFMRLIRNAGGHDYPFFKSQHEQLKKVLDFELPEYHFSMEQLRKIDEENQQNNGSTKTCFGYKGLLVESIAGLKEYVENGALEDAQQLAIDMGTLIEAMCGEGSESVHRLEKFCEALYLASMSEGNSNVNECVDTVELAINDEILSHSEAIFLVNKPEQVKCLEKFIKTESLVNLNEVTILVVPYFYKNYDGSFHDVVFKFDEVKEEVNKIAGIESDDFDIKSGKNRNIYQNKNNNQSEQKIKLLSADEYDIELHHPDKIYMIWPYDEWSPVVSTEEKYFARNLQSQCNELVYVQAFELLDFGKDSFREFSNMKYYVTVPGVVMADKIYVPTEMMRQTYVDKLAEWAGEETREIWEKKVVIAEPSSIVQEPLEKDGIKVGNMNAGSMEAENPESCKQIAFFVQMGTIVQYGSEMLDKISRVLNTFEENKQVKMLWIYDSRQDEDLYRFDSLLCEKYQKLRDDYENLNQDSTQDERGENIQSVVEKCNAYYGDESHLALEFEMVQKPVMIMNVEV